MNRMVLAVLMMISVEVVQAQDMPQPHHVGRPLLISNVIFAGSIKPFISAGGLYQWSLQKTRYIRGEHGEIITVPPRFWLHMLGSGTYGLKKKDFGFAASLGIAYRTDASFGRVVGIIGQVMGPDMLYGPALRVELIDNVGFQTGYLFGEDRTMFVSIDFFADLCKDLHLCTK